MLHIRIINLLAERKNDMVSETDLHGQRNNGSSDPHYSN